MQKDAQACRVHSGGPFSFRMACSALRLGARKALIAQLLALLAEAAEAADRCGGALAEEKNPAEEDSFGQGVWTVFCWRRTGRISLARGLWTPFL